MVSRSDREDGGGCRRRPCGRVRHDRGACGDVTVAERVPGCRTVDQRVTIDRCVAVDRCLTDHAEPWQWLRPRELPEHVGDRPSDAARRRDSRSESGNEPAAICSLIEQAKMADL